MRQATATGLRACKLRAGAPGAAWADDVLTCPRLTCPRQEHKQSSMPAGCQQRQHGPLTLVSSTLLSVGDTLTNMSVLAVPPSESDMSMVSLWLR